MILSKRLMVMRQSNAINKSLTDQVVDINLVFVFWMDYAVNNGSMIQFNNVLNAGNKDD